MSENMLGVKEVGGVVTDLLEKLGGENGQEWFTETKRFLRKEPCWVGNRESPIKKDRPRFSDWAYIGITIGGVSISELRERFNKGHFHVEERARDIMRMPTFKISTEPHQVGFVRVEIGDLGFTKEPTTKELFSRKQLFGYALCEAEDGPHLRLALTNQPLDNRFWLAMESIERAGRPFIFCIKRSFTGENWLITDYIRPNHRWRLESEIVFRSFNK